MAVFKQRKMIWLSKGVLPVVLMSFFPTLARAAFLSYLLIFLGGIFELSVDQIGIFFGGFVLFSSVLSIVLAPVIDRLQIKIIMLVTSVAQALMYVTLFMLNSVVLAFVLCLVLNLAYISLETALRMYIGQSFQAEKAVSVLSLKYTLTDMAYVLGPLAGLWLNRNGISPFLFSCAAALFFTLICACRFPPQMLEIVKDDKRKGLFASLVIMSKDKTLLKFTIVGVLLSAVFGQFHIYLGQYLSTFLTVQRMYEIINMLFITNALTSIILQYVIGQLVTVRRFRSWICCCILVFGIGLSGFAVSSHIYAWVVFTVFFTIGEIIFQLLEFLYINNTAPRHLIGTYYSSQNLTYLGASSTPIVCGFMLANFAPLYFFLYLLTLLLVGGGIFYLEAGKTIRPPSHDS